MKITREMYRSMGGVQGALGGRAQALYENTPETEREALRAALVQLADVNERGDFTRRRAFLEALPDAARPAVERFVAARLLMTGEAGGRASVEVAHEALLRNWDLLNGWLEGETERLRLRRDLDLDLANWESHAKSPAYLWRAERLAAGLDLMGAEGWPEGDRRRAFLGASRRLNRANLQRESDQLGHRVLSDYTADPERGILLALFAIAHYTWTPRAELALNGSIDASRVRAHLRGHEGYVWSVAFSPDGERVLTGSYDKTARLWDAASGEQIHALRGHEGWVRSVAFSPDGERLLTGSSDKTARLWDAASGEPIHALRGHEGWVRSVAFSPDGERVLTGSSDKTARLWDAASGEQIHALRGHKGSVRSVAFSPDGERLVTGSYDNTARLWRALTRDKLVEFARTRVYRELTQDERRQYGLPLRQ